MVKNKPPMPPAIPRENRKASPSCDRDMIFFNRVHIEFLLILL
jgi:hypothetical protein